MAKAKSTRRVGRPSRTDLGLDPTRQVTIKVESLVLATCLEKFGSVNQALKYAADASKGPKAA